MFAQELQSGRFKNIIICSGAGVSTGAGIPDYRSENGIFAKLAEKYPGFEGSDIFSRWFRDLHPEFLKSSEYIKLVDMIRNASPTPAHHLAVWLHNQGWLKRVYTQNIDGLYTKAGLPPDKLVEFHGSIDNVVLYDDPIPETCLHVLKGDHMDIVHSFGSFGSTSGCDLMLVMGTSLQVAPFCAIPNMVPENCVRAYVDLNPSFENGFSQISGGGMYSTYTTDNVKFYRYVDLRSFWNSGWKKYKEQRIIQEDCSVFSDSVIPGYPNH